LPACGSPASPRDGASAECLQLLRDVQARPLCDPLRAAGLRQLSADAHAAQHAGSDVSPTATALALVGLHLALDLGVPASEVRAAQRELAQAAGSHPNFVPPAHRGDLTVFDVAESGCAGELACRVQAWAHAVWAAWEPQHPAVASLAERHHRAADGLRAAR
jgi:hypothetical protein